ncbi:MAG: hypothetical protein PWP24_455 [Clostridiales bacterium]|nr:hypothetical protein [Clostridiales bacterium]
MSKESKERPKSQRIVAVIGIIVLVSLYIATLISAIFTTPATKGLFMACIFSTVAIPVMIYAYMLVYRLLKKKRDEIVDNQ